MPAQTAQQIIAAARRNAANLPSEQAAARERRNTARKAAHKAREAAKPVRATRELPPIDGAHWVRRRYGSNWVCPAIQISSPHVARLIAQWAPRSTQYVETSSTWGLYVWNSRSGPEPVLAQEGWYIVRTKYGLRVMQPGIFQQLYDQYSKYMTPNTYATGTTVATPTKTRGGNNHK